MGCPSEVEIGDNLVFTVTTHDPDTGVVTDADAVPAYRVYEDETGTAILNGNMAKLDDANTTGFYSESIACTSGNGFENGKSYNVYIEATVDSDKGAISYGFKAYDVRKSDLTQIGTAAQSATDLKDFADEGYNPATNKVTGVLLTDTVTTLTGHTAQTADHTAGIADVPTVAEFNARTIAAASYFDPAADTVANVTAVGSVTGNVGGNVTGSVASVVGAVVTDAASRTASKADVSALATAAALSTHDGKLDTAQADLDKLTGTDGATLATAQGNYAPAKAGDAMTLAANAVDAASTAADYLAEVKAQVVAALSTDTYAEPGQGAPPATASLEDKIGYLFKFARNKIVQDATTLEVYNDAGDTVDQKATVSDDGTDFTRGEIGTGP